MFDIQSSTARRPHKSPAHTVKDLNHLLTVSVSALEHFVPSEPLILHRFSCPSTPSAKSFCCRCCRPEGDASGGRRIIGRHPTFDKQFLKLFLMFRVRRCSHAKLSSPTRRDDVASQAINLCELQHHAGEVALADLQNPFKTRGKHALRIFDDFRVDAHRAFLELAIRLGVTRRKACCSK